MTLTVRESWVTLPNGARVHLQRAGEGDPVLLLHGIAHSSRAWQRLLVPLAEDHDVIALDLPGCGRSDKPHTDYSLGSQAAAVRHVLDALDIDLVTVIGHSLGGGVAMTLSYQHPDRVGRLGLISSGGLGRELHPIFRLATLPVVPDWVMRVIFDPRARLPRNLARGTLAHAGHDPLFFHSGACRDEVDELLEPMEDPAAQRAFLQMLRSASNLGGQAISALDRLGVALFPVLIVWGRQDAVFPVTHAEQAASLIPHARLVIIEECGHLPQLEAAPQLQRAVADWLAETRPTKLDISALHRRLEQAS